MSEVYKLNPPLTIQIEGSQILISDGKYMSLKAPSGKIVINSKYPITFEIKSEARSKLAVAPKEMNDDFIYAFTSKSDIPSRGIRAEYHYYYRKDDQSWCVLVERGDRTRKYALGSLKGADSLLSQGYNPLPRGKWFCKKELYDVLPIKLRHGQIVKALLDILVKEGFLTKRRANGLKEEFKVADKSIGSQVEKTE